MTPIEGTGIPEVDAILAEVDKDFSIFPNILIHFPAEHDPDEYGCVDLGTATETDGTAGDEYPAAELMKNTIDRWEATDGLLCFHSLETLLLQMGLDYLEREEPPPESESYAEIGPLDEDWDDDYEVEDVGKGIEGLYEEAELFEVLHKCLLRVGEKGLTAHYHLDPEALSPVEMADVEYLFPANDYGEEALGTAMWDTGYEIDSEG